MDEHVPIVASLAVAVVLVATGVVVSRVTRRAADGRLARNGIAGVRTRATMASDEAWRAGHAAARRLSDVAGVVFAMTGLATLLPQRAMGFLAVVLVGTVVATALLLSGVRRAARAAGART